MASSSSRGGRRSSSSRPPAWAVGDHLGLVFSQLGDSPGYRILSAAARGDIPLLKKIAKRLQAAGKSAEEEVMAVNAPLTRRGPLHRSAWAGKLVMCKFLVKDLGFDVNAVDSDGRAPLHFAIQGHGGISVVRFLVDRGADLNKADRYGLTPLHAATIGDMYEIAELLLSRGAYVDPVCEKGAPLHIAANDGNSRMMKLLLEHRADPNRVVQLFYTPMIVSLFSCSLQCVELLIKAGADVNASKPVTPLIVAANDGLADCIKCLLEAGADANIPDEIGRMPVEIAAIQGWKECAEILFPFTCRITSLLDWNIDGLFQNVQFGSPKTQDHACHENMGSFAEVQGDDAYEEKDFAHASAFYTVVNFFVSQTSSLDLICGLLADNDYGRSNIVVVNSSLF